MRRLSQNIIEHARRLYPSSLHYRGQFTDKQYYEIEKQCEIHCSSEYMDGSRMYCIRYKSDVEPKELKKMELVEVPFDWNDNFSKLAQEDFSMIQKDLPYCTCQSIGLALAKLQLLEKQGCRVEV